MRKSKENVCISHGIFFKSHLKVKNSDVLMRISHYIMRKAAS